MADIFSAGPGFIHFCLVCFLLFILRQAFKKPNEDEES